MFISKFSAYFNKLLKLLMVIAYADLTNPPFGSHSFPNLVIVVKFQNANNLLNLRNLIHEILCIS